MATIASVPVSNAIKAPVVSTTEVPLDDNLSSLSVSAFGTGNGNKNHREADRLRQAELQRLRETKTKLDKELSSEKAEVARLKAELVEAKKKPKDAPHPILPSGNILEDVQTHVVCQSWFVQSVHELCEEHKKLKIELVRKTDLIRRQANEIVQLREDLDDSRKEADDYRLALVEEQASHKLTRDRLVKVEKENKRLQADIIVLQGKLDEALVALREKTHRLNEALRDINQLKTTITHLNANIVELEAKLKESNESEDRANDRVAELQRYIYELERKKNALEREKDSEQEKKRNAEAMVESLQRRIDDMNKRIRPFHGENN